MDVTEITGDLVSYDSSSQLSNAKVSSAVAGWMRKAGMTVEQVSYTDGNGVKKVNVVGKKGRGTGGLAILGHSDVVPAGGWDSDPFRLSARNGKLYGRGSADMKGPIACGLVAAQVFSKKELRRPVYVIVTADEEIENLQEFPDQIWHHCRTHIAGCCTRPQRFIEIRHHRKREGRSQQYW